MTKKQTSSPARTSTSKPAATKASPAASATQAPAPTAHAAAPSSRPPAPRPRPRTIPPQPASATATTEATREERIAMAAYLRAERSGFLTDPLENWLAAEREVDAPQAFALH